MTTLVNIARYHLVDRLTYVILPWGLMAFSFLVNLGVGALVPNTPQGYYTGGLATIYIYLLVCGTLSMTRSLPFGLMLGVGRRGYYLGTAMLVASVGVVYGLALTILQVIERATGGWGLGVHFFRIPWILDGPWYRIWPTSFLLLVLFFLYGMWYGLVYRRWNLPGLLAFVAAQVLAALVVVVVVSMTHNWHAFGHFLAALTAWALIGVLAAVAVAMGVGGFTTMRRVTI
ncbi:MAG: ABC transporter permease [Actinobacteria bacterium]|nr:ABC transporter permease [Actinomycetota bacterium]